MLHSETLAPDFGRNSYEIHLGPPQYQTTVSFLPITFKANFGISDDQHTGEDFLDELKSEPFEYTISSEETAEDNPPRLL
ncbi:MAG: hypothetical protein ACRDF4_09300 [Rhabdochlamydiaceae bacterium]